MFSQRFYLFPRTEFQVTERAIRCRSVRASVDPIRCRLWAVSSAADTYLTVISIGCKLGNHRPMEGRRLRNTRASRGVFMSTDEAADAIFKSLFPQPVGSTTSVHARVLRERAPFNITETDSRLIDAARANARARGHRS